MNCRQVRDYLAPLLDGELPEAQTEILLLHLETCPVCLALFEQLSAQEFHPPPLPPQVHNPRFWEAMDQRINAVLSEELAKPLPPPTLIPGDISPQSPKWWIFPRWLPDVARVAVLMLGIGTILWALFQPSEPLAINPQVISPARPSFSPIPFPSTPPIIPVTYTTNTLNPLMLPSPPDHHARGSF